MDAKKAIEEAKGDVEKAVEIIRAKGLAKAEQKSEREVNSGKVYTYTHAGGLVGAMVEIACETDFVSSTSEIFQKYLYNPNHTFPHVLLHLHHYQLSLIQVFCILRQAVLPRS